ncbi:MAG: adenylyl-sulfate kinase [Saezia sp.]
MVKSKQLNAATLWLTGLPASGKTTLANSLCQTLRKNGKQAVVLDGDELRKGLSADLRFSEADRNEHVRRVGALACVLGAQGVYAVVSLISPYRAVRDAVRQEHEKQNLAFTEIFVDTPLEECIKRDPKGLYAKALAGELQNMTGIDAPYEAPLQPNVHVTAYMSIDEAVALVLKRFY